MFLKKIHIDRWYIRHCFPGNRRVSFECLGVARDIKGLLLEYRAKIFSRITYNRENSIGRHKSSKL